MAEDDGYLSLDDAPDGAWFFDTLTGRWWPRSTETTRLRDGTRVVSSFLRRFGALEQLVDGLDLAGVGRGDDPDVDAEQAAEISALQGTAAQALTAMQTSSQDRAALRATLDTVVAQVATLQAQVQSLVAALAAIPAPVSYEHRVAVRSVAAFLVAGSVDVAVTWPAMAGVPTAVEIRSQVGSTVALATTVSTSVVAGSMTTTGCTIRVTTTGALVASTLVVIVMRKAS